MNLKAIITVGISNSGKSTWAEAECRKDPDWWNINRDDIRFMLTGARNWKDYKFNVDMEKAISKEIQKTLFQTAFDNNKNIIVSDTGLHKERRIELMHNLSAIGFAVRVMSFPVSLEEALERNKFNDKKVPEEVIRKQWEQWKDYERGK